MTPMERISKAGQEAAATDVEASRAMTPAQRRASTFRKTEGAGWPRFEGWHLIGAFPDYEPGDVGSWLLMNNGEAMLLEVPEGLTVQDVQDAVKRLNVKLRYVTASHDHWDHLDRNVWGDLAGAFPKAKFVHPASVCGDHQLQIGSEVVWLVAAPKHSLADVVTVFRGVAMNGDIELRMLGSVTNEVPLATRRRSMQWLQGFQERAGYHVHTCISAHLDDVRVGVNWPDLFRYEEAKLGKRTQCRRYGCWGKLVPMEPDLARLGSGFDMK